MAKRVEQFSVGGTEDLDRLVDLVEEAQRVYSSFSQEQVDYIFQMAAAAANKARIDLAELAVQETGRGIVEDKVIKNHFASEYIYNKYKNTKTCGVVDSDEAAGYRVVAEPLGIIAGVIPVTNPTSTAIFKALLALKTRNAIIVSPHPNAKNCTVRALEVVLRAAVVAGAPMHIIAWLDEPTLDLTHALITHRKIHTVLATGGPSMVKAAYTSGKPALGVGAGNVPVVVDETADAKLAVSSIVLSKSFDNGMICASEQSVVVVDSQYQVMKDEFIYRGCYFLTNEESVQLEKLIKSPKGGINSAIVGHSALEIAALAGLSVPPDTKVLISEQRTYTYDNIFAHEKLSPILTMYHASDFKQAVEIALALVHLGGMGHSAVLYTDPKRAHNPNLEYFAHVMPTGRILVNSPSSQGGIGDLYNFYLTPSLTLGCGSWGGNSVSENVGIKHLLNYKTVAERRENMLWFKVPPKIYFKRGSIEPALRELVGRKRAFIVTDRFLFESGATKQIERVLSSIGLEIKLFFEVLPDPCLSTVQSMLVQVGAYQPDVIVAVGGGSPMDAAKILWLMYEHPEVNFEDIAMRFMDIRKRICSLPTLGSKALMVAIPTTSGTGSEVTPFSIITDDDSQVKYAIADYALTPSMAIIDPDMVDNMPKGLTSAGGIDALVHATESYVSTLATEFTKAYSLQAIHGVFEWLPRAYVRGSDDPEAREHMHYTATIAGMAFANAFLGVCHSMAHKLGNAFHIPHGIANALLFCQVMAYNANDRPTKQAIFPQYQIPSAKQRYAELARSMHLGKKGDSDNKLVNSYIRAVMELKAAVEIPSSIKEWGVKPEQFTDKLDELVKLAFDDQCTGANPVYPLMSEIKQIYLDAYEGKVNFLEEK